MHSARCARTRRARGGLLDATQLSRRIADLAVDGKALDVTVVDVRGRTGYTDYLVIASGTSDRHVQSVAENVAGALTRDGTRPLGREGLREGQWALVDFGTVVLHVFHQFSRDVYRLEQMWEDAPTQVIHAPVAPRRDAPTQGPAPAWAP